MSAEILRQAAALMRERAKACMPDGTEGYADWHESYWYDGPGSEDAQHQASWHPAVALAVAGSLEAAADGWATDPGCDLGGGYDFSPACESCFRCCAYETQMRALAVARAYLGVDQ